MIDVHDDRMSRRAAFQAKDLANRVRVIGIGAQPVDRFCRERDEFAGTQRLNRLLHFFLQYSSDSHGAMIARQAGLPAILCRYNDTGRRLATWRRPDCAGSTRKTPQRQKTGATIGVAAAYSSIVRVQPWAVRRNS